MFEWSISLVTGEESFNESLNASQDDQNASSQEESILEEQPSVDIPCAIPTINSDYLEALPWKL